MKMNQRFAWLALLAGLVSSVSRAEEIAVVKEQTVNVRGQASLIGEVITQLKKGEKVVVLEEISVAKPQKDEPAKWAKIQMPANTPVWVNALFIDSETKSVKPNRLNLRGGPGENYSVVGRLQHGDQVKEIRTVNDWMEIETPPGAYAFVAANLISKEVTPVPVTPAPTAAKIEKSEPPPAQPLPVPVPPPAQVTEKNIQPEPAPVAVVDNTAVKTETTPVVPATPPKPIVVVPPVQPPTESVKEPETLSVLARPPRRIVRREGIVRGTISIQAPTYYELVGPDSSRVINYLHLNQGILDKLGTSIKDFKEYVGRAVVVTGEEGIDPRWPKTPVIEIETLKLVL